MKERDILTGNEGVAETNYKPSGKGYFGNIYTQFKGKVKEGIDFLSRVRSGALQGVWHRNGIGDIDLVWGNDGGGLCHILKKHINDKDFKNKADFVNRLNDIINNGNVDFDNGDKVVLKKNGYIVTIRKNIRENGKKIADENWVLTAYNKDAPATTKAPADGTDGSTAVAPGASYAAKVGNPFENVVKKGENVSDIEDIIRKDDNQNEGNGSDILYRKVTDKKEIERQWILNRIDHQTDKNSDYMGRQFTDEGWPKGMESARAIRESQETIYHPSDTPSENFAREEYERRLKRAGYVWDEAYIDYMQAAQELTESITGRKIKDLDPNENFVMAENHLDSTNAQVHFDLYQSYFKPLTESVSKVLCNFSGKLDERIRQLQLYMVQKHGLERNRVFFVRDFLDEMDSRINASDPDAPTQDDIDTLRGDFNGLRAQLKAKLDKGDINLRDYFVELDSWITTNLTSDYKASERDYSGLSEMTNGRMADGRVKNGYDEDQILANVMDTEDMLGKDIVKDLWDKTKACCITTKSHDLSDELKKLPANNYGQSRCKYLTNILGGFIISYCRQNGLMISMHCSPHAK